MEDLFRAGGPLAVLPEHDLLDPTAITVTGGTLVEPSPASRSGTPR